MALDGFDTPLDIVSSDIKKVGGQNAFLGMLRYSNNGKVYELVRMISGGSITGALGKYILGYKGGQAAVQTTGSGARCSGVTVTTANIVANDYFWMQIAGRADGVFAPNATIGTWIQCVGAGVGGSLTPVNVVDSSAGAFTLNNNGVIGWALSDADSDNLISLIIKQQHQWTGTGAGVSFEEEIA